MTEIKYKSHWLNSRKIRENNVKFIFGDVETKELQMTYKEKRLIFYLACFIFWNRLTGEKIEKSYWNRSELWNEPTRSEFWDDVEKQYDFNSKDKQEIIFYTHNCEFDFKLLNGYNELKKRGWKLKSWYIKNLTFILNWQKNNCKLTVWSTTNYTTQSLEKIGKSLKFPKLPIIFKTTTDKYLEKYCKQDTEIVYQFVKGIIEFLEENGLGQLKATAASTSMNIFLSKYYHPNRNDVKTLIGIHSWKEAQKLERESLHGGFAEVFKQGSYEVLDENNKFYKVDFNSFYSYQMRNEYLPTKLIGYINESKYHKKYGYVAEHLSEFIDYLKKNADYLFTIDCTVEITKEFAYVFNNFKEVSSLDKMVFFSGITRLVLNTPTLEFIREHCKILKIHRVNVYEKVIIFKEFVDDLFEKKVIYGEQGNESYKDICKIILNAQYGKWSQRFTELKKLDLKSDFWVNNGWVIVDWIVNVRKIKINSELKEIPFLYVGSLDKIEYYFISGKLWYFRQTQENAKNAFVAISSFITDYARMMLVKTIFIAGRKNVFNTDTDSLIVNEIGLQNLKKAGLIHLTKLGFLKIEGTLTKGEKLEIINPKHYNFGSDKKCKGVRKGSIVLEDNEKETVYMTEVWQKLKTDAKDGIISEQVVVLRPKRVSKIYSKGKVDKDGNVSPWSVSEIINNFPKKEIVNEEQNIEITEIRTQIKALS